MLTKTWIEQIKHAYALKHKYCKVCKQTGDIRVCGNCKESVYCSVGCQTIDYNVHQTICGEVVLDDNLSKLPKDVLNLIVNKLSKMDVDNLTQQSKWINRILKDYFYTKKYRFHIKDIENFDCTPDNTFFKKIENIKIDGDFDSDNFYKIYTCFPNIKKLELWDYNEDITPLSNLTQLQTLKLIWFNGDNIKPLKNLTRLQELYLSSYNGDNIKPLENMTQLRLLNLDAFKGDLTPLENLTQLQSLELILFKGDLTPLENLTQLQSLVLSSYNGDNIKPLKNLTQLQELYLSNYNGDLTPLENLTQLRTLYLLNYNGDNIKPLSNLTQLRTLYLFRYNGDLTPLENMIQLRTLRLPGFTGNYDQFKNKYL